MLVSISLGLLAAFAWGVHDTCVRYVSARLGAFAPLTMVMLFGLILVAPVSIWQWQGDAAAALTGTGLLLAAICGGFFAIATLSLYFALAIGPVKLVTPIVGSYPILSLLWAMANGTTITLLQWALVIAIIAGVSYVATGAAKDDRTGRAGHAILFAITSGAGFAIAFAVGQAATQYGGEIILQTPTRIAALLVVLTLAAIARKPVWPGRGALKILFFMGLLDAMALAAVTGAGVTARPEFASVTSSIFGLVTVVLAAIVLGEKLTFRQWLVVPCVFLAVAGLGI